jgi:hypothetical protein
MNKKVWIGISVVVFVIALVVVSIIFWYDIKAMVGLLPEAEKEWYTETKTFKNENMLMTEASDSEFYGLWKIEKRTFANPNPGISEIIVFYVDDTSLYWRAIYGDNMGSTGECAFVEKTFFFRDEKYFVYSALKNMIIPATNRHQGMWLTQLQKNWLDYKLKTGNSVSSIFIQDPDSTPGKSFEKSGDGLRTATATHLLKGKENTIKIEINHVQGQVTIRRGTSASPTFPLKVDLQRNILDIPEAQWSDLLAPNPTPTPS